MSLSKKTGRFVGGYKDRWGVQHRGWEEYEALTTLLCGLCGDTMPTGSKFIRKQFIGFESRRIPTCFKCAEICETSDKEAKA